MRIVTFVALLCGLLVSAGSPAEAAPRKPTRAALATALSATSQVRGGTPIRVRATFTVRRTNKFCDRARGRVMLYVDGRRVAQRAITSVRTAGRKKTHRRAVVRMTVPAATKVGTHRIRVAYVAAGGPKRCRAVWGAKRKITVRSPWVRTTTESFSGTTLPKGWSAYSGQPSSDPWTRWHPDRARVANGALVLDGVPQAGDRRYWHTGGVSYWPAQTYGQWKIRFRSPVSSILSYHLLLWPAAEKWPPEIDIAESWDRSRRKIEAFLHYAKSDGNRGRVDAAVHGDFTKWNEIGVIWRPGRLQYTLNGKVWATFTGAAVPREPMFLALQTETQMCNRSTSDCTSDSLSSRPRIEIDRVTVDAYRP